MVVHRTAFGTCVVVLMAASGIVACSQERCLPEALEVSPETVAPGEAVTVSSPAAGCVLAPPRDGGYRLTLVGFADSWELGAVDPAADGAFATTVTIPPAAPAGRASIVVTGSAYDDCPDGGSCVGYQVDVRIE